MATAEFNRMMLWTDLEDTVVAGRWRIVRLVRPEGRMAWFEATSLDGKPLMLSITETLNDDDELLSRLRAAAEIRHPNVIRIVDSVADAIDDSPVVIAAMERTEENLEDVLRDRPLNSSEAQVVLDALVQGIAAIHARGLVHGRMEASSVLALGETIKLRSDCLQVPQTGFAAAAAANVQGIGRIVTHAMTRRDPFGENDPVLQLLPEPLARAVRRALSGHARVDEIALLAGIRIIPARDPEPEVRQPARPMLVSTAPVHASEPAPAPTKSVTEASPKSDPPSAIDKATASEPAKPVTAAEAAPVPAQPLGEAAQGSAPASVQDSAAPRTVPAPLPAPAEPRQPKLFPSLAPAPDLSHLLVDEDEDRPLWRRPSAPWVIGGAAAVLLITIVTLFALLHRSPAPKAAKIATAPVVVTQPMHPSPAKTSPAAAAPAQVAAAQPGWRVVAWTYDRQSDAQHKADALAKKYPQLQPAVFRPKGRGPYLVVLGGVMSKDQAFALRKQAVRLGLPRDSYAQNYR
ncbi:MAG TPA: hypothetical protein VGS02_11800 [Acidobacteriaceae bacterium]|nr:hypothetical protein [Acidobacteriaceae bacterium]